MQFNPAEVDPKVIYKLLTGVIIPRPIGWISTIDKAGIPNLAPFSYFNAVGNEPPHVMFSTTHTDKGYKDTLNNVLATNEFVVNMVTEELAEKMNLTSKHVPAEEDEFVLAGLTPLASIKVKPARVKESPIALECEMVHHYTIENDKFGGSTIVIGRVLMFHIDDSIMIEDHKINLDVYRPIARLAGANYSKLGEIFSVKR